jgi:hypothetical protein
MLREVRGWDPDIEGLVGAVAEGQLGARVSAAIGVLREEHSRVSVGTLRDNLAAP